MTTTPGSDVDPGGDLGPGGLPEPIADLALRVGGTVVAVWAAVLLGLVGAFETPARFGGELVPVSVLLAIVGNAGLIRFAYVTTRHRGLAVLPGVTWIVLAFVATAGTSEGDVVLTSANWVGPVYLLAGSATVAVSAYRLLPRPPTSRRSWR